MKNSYVQFPSLVSRSRLLSSSFVLIYSFIMPLLLGAGCGVASKQVPSANGYSGASAVILAQPDKNSVERYAAAWKSATTWRQRREICLEEMDGNVINADTANLHLFDLLFGTEYRKNLHESIDTMYGWVAFDDGLQPDLSVHDTYLGFEYDSDGRIHEFWITASQKWGASGKGVKDARPQ